MRDLVVARGKVMQFNWLTWAAIASVAGAIAGSNAGMHLAVAPATSAYQTCVEAAQADIHYCQAKLHRDWPKYSGERIKYAVLAGLAPLPIIWIACYGFRTQRSRTAASGIRKKAPA
jgi:hypothetical protein